MLPLRDPASIVSLGERITPILRLHSLERTTGAGTVWVKDEAMMPTGSFKARGLALAISKAKELGIRHVCIPSAGNAAGACAAYAARGGLECTIVVPEDTPGPNIEESLAYGADVRTVRGTIADAGKELQRLRSEHADWFDVSTLKEPYRLEGKKTMGYELAEQFDWHLPDVIIYPTGGGTGLIGMWKAFDEMERLGWIGGRRPRMVSSQSAGCAPIVRAYEAGAKESVFWENAHTIASGLRVPKPFADHLILKAIQESGGTAVAVTDDAAMAAVKEIGRAEGIFLCPEGATTVVALKMLAGQGLVGPEDTVLLWNTAAGVKYPGLIKH
jgi:threonine synthase